MNEVYVLGERVDGSEVYKCECGWATTGKFAARQHTSDGCELPKVWGPTAGVLEPLRDDLAGMLDEYRRQVESEVVDLLAMNLDATGAAYRREGKTELASRYENASFLIGRHREEWL